MSEEIKTQDSGSKKEYTFFAQVIASVWVAGWNAFQFVKTILSGGKVSVLDIVVSGLAIAACFAPVYVSIILDKIKEIKSLDK